MRWLLIAGLAALFHGCSSDERPPMVGNVGTGGRLGPGTTGGSPSTGGATNEAGAAGEGTVGGAGGEGGAVDDVDPRAPIVEVTSPTALSDPNEGEVLLANSVEVLCRVQKSAAAGAVAVAPATVVLTMLDATGKVLKETGGTPTGNDGEYAVNFQLTEQAHGRVKFRCRASDTGSPALTGSAEVSSFVDRGPSIEIVSPGLDSIMALKVAVPFEFTVTEAPLLASGDDGAAIGDITLTVDGVPFEVEPAPNRPGVYIAAVDFTDPVLFREAPTGPVSVVITARNQRTPEPALRTLNFTFTLDGEGPTISITKPKSEEIVGRALRLEFKVSDALSGVDKSKVKVKLNADEYTFEAPPSALWSESNGNFVFTFDRTKIVASVSQATINIHAEDLVGNAADGESLIVFLDDFPPIVSLNPENIRVVYEPASATAAPKCSSLFDPLGERAVNDLATVQDFALFRALVWDLTNHGADQEIDYLSGTDPSTVSLYLQPDPEQPLLIDDDGDGICNDLRTVDEAGNPLEFISLSPLDSQGTPPKLPADDWGEAPAVDLLGCEPMSNANQLCLSQFSDMQYVLRHTIPVREEAVVFGRNPGANTTLTCTGADWSISALAGRSGWICLAASATDFANNKGISAPLRVCMRNPGDASNPCLDSPPPTCTDGCSPPPEFPSQVIRF